MASLQFVGCLRRQATSSPLAGFPGYSGHGTAHATTNTMIIFNSAINPIVYALVNQRFREKIKGMICCICPPANNRINIQRIEIVNRATDPPHETEQSSKQNMGNIDISIEKDVVSTLSYGR